MFIECPYCHSRAKLPDSKEGAKVRCGECGRVYVAREPSRAGRSRGGGRSSSANTGLFVGIGVAVVAAILLALMANTGGKDPGPRIEEPDEEPIANSGPVDTTGWNSAPVQAAVAIHDAAFTYNEGRVQSMLHVQRLWERVAAEDEEAAMGSFGSATRDDREKLLLAAVDGIVNGEDRELVGEWKAYDGEVLEETPDTSHVRLSLTSRDPERAGEKRSIDWQLAKDGERWKAFQWARFIAAGEIKPTYRGPRGIEKVTLSDGSKVYERQPEALAHLEDTPPEMREKIDTLFRTLIDLDLPPRQSSGAMRELESIGKPAIPILLTGLFEIKLETLDQTRQVNLILQCLRSITAQDFGWKPQVAVGSGTGTSAERRDSAIKQWFAWWYRKAKRFEVAEKEDALDGLLEARNEKERRILEKERAKQEND